jgi:two-component system, NtrC family, response regulator AtoC
MELSGTLLVVDDDAAVGMVLAALARQAGMEVFSVSSGEAALLELERRPIDVVLTDLQMPGLGGIELLRVVSTRWPEIPVVIVTAHGTVPAAVEAMKLGAADFVQKPLDRDELLFVLGKALASAEREQDRRGPSSAPVGDFVGSSTPMREAYDLLAKAARGTATVLLRGESGTGKELAAHALHQLSPRSEKPFVRIHCGALPDNLLESELFGYEKGAFTGAVSRKPGRLELANGGTAFLDEIGDISPAVQVKLLRVLQDRSFERLGGSETLKIDVRFVAATHQNLEKLVHEHKFREDLFYRLNVVPVWLPPLRERREEIPELARHFVKKHGTANGKPTATIAGEALELLKAQPWPGNVRQLENFLERVLVLSDHEQVTRADIERELARGISGLGASTSTPVEPTGGAMDGGLTGLNAQRRKSELEAIQQALRATQGNRSRAAQVLGVSRRTLYNKLKELGIERSSGDSGS